MGDFGKVLQALSRRGSEHPGSLTLVLSLILAPAVVSIIYLLVTPAKAELWKRKPHLLAIGSGILGAVVFTGVLAVSGLIPRAGPVAEIGDDRASSLIFVVGCAFSCFALAVRWLKRRTLPTDAEEAPDHASSGVSDQGQEKPPQ